VKVRDGKAEVIATRAATVEEKTVVRFDAAPTSGQYIISRQ